MMTTETLRRNGRHECAKEGFVCFGNNMLRLTAEYEGTDIDGFGFTDEVEVCVEYCPFCGYNPQKKSDEKDIRE
jgi:hypothetical protein